MSFSVVILNNVVVKRLQILETQILSCIADDSAVLKAADLSECLQMKIVIFKPIQNGI